MCQIEIRSTTLKVDDDENFEAKRSLSLSFKSEFSEDALRFRVFRLLIVIMEYPNNINV